jgi:hypothetical protein
LPEIKHILGSNTSAESAMPAGSQQRVARGKKISKKFLIQLSTASFLSMN